MRRRAFAVVVCLLAGSARLYGQSIVELNDAGWKALAAGNGDRAARLFIEALSYAPDDPVLLYGAGAAAHARGRFPDALSYLKRAVKADPALVGAARLLGLIAYEQGEIDLAISTYQQALKHAPGDAQLTNSLAVWRTDAANHERFEERRYDRFRVMFEGRAEESLATKATAVLNSAFWRIGNTLGAFPADPITTVLYTQQQYREITHAPDWSGGMYDGRMIRVPAAGASADPEEFERLLTHELSHAMVAALAPRGVPAWLNEGMAQYFEGRDVAAAAQRLKRAGVFVPLRALEGGFGRLNASQARIAYDESLVAVNVIFQRPSFGWSHLLRALGERQPFERAIVSFGFSYDDLEAPLKK